MSEYLDVKRCNWLGAQYIPILLLMACLGLLGRFKQACALRQPKPWKAYSKFALSSWGIRRLY